MTDSHSQNHHTPSTTKRKPKNCRDHRNKQGQFKQDNVKNIHKQRKNSKKRNTKTIKVRKYRKDKTNPKRTTISITEDIGRFQQVTTFISPNLDKRETVQPKEANPNMEQIINDPIRLIWYYDTSKGFIYGKNREYLGTIQKYHLKRLFAKIGEVLRKEKT